MSTPREVACRLCSILVLVLASVGLWGVTIRPVGVFIALNVGAAVYAGGVLVEWIRGGG